MGNNIPPEDSDSDMESENDMPALLSEDDEYDDNRRSRSRSSGWSGLGMISPCRNISDGHLSHSGEAVSEPVMGPRLKRLKDEEGFNTKQQLPCENLRHS